MQRSISKDNNYMFTKVYLIENLTKNTYKQGSRLLWYTAMCHDPGNDEQCRY